MDQFVAFPLDDLAQHARINRLYTQITLCFPLQEDIPISETTIIQSLEHGLQQLSLAFPWISGTVSKQDKQFKIVPSEQAMSLRVQKLAESFEFPDWKTLQQANFPFSMLDEKVIAPRNTLATEQELEKGLPVFLAQANFVKGGLLLTLQGQHGAMDMAGLAQAMHLYAKACRGEAFTSEELEAGNTKRDGTIPIFPDGEFEDAIKASAERIDNDEPISAKLDIRPIAKLSWAYLNFSKAALHRLKAQAMEHVPLRSFVSTDDVLSAYIWQAITRARLPRLSNATGVTTTLSRNVDVRKVLSASPTYPGLLVTSTEYTCGIETILDEDVTSLGAISSHLRGLLDPESLRFSARLAATKVVRGQSSSSSRASRPELDVRLSSWAKERCYDLDFGFGKPVAVRRPAFMEGAREGLVYFLPASPSGDIVVGVCLGIDDLERLRNLDSIKADSSYIG